MKPLPLIITAILVLLLTACRTTQQALPIATASTQTQTKYVHIETIDTVYVNVPEQSAERTTNQPTSFLETDFATSSARINDDGTLTHLLHNKPGAKPTTVKITSDTITQKEYISEPYPVEVPRSLTWWQQTRLTTWPWLALALLLTLICALRRPILTLIFASIKKFV